MPTVVEWDDAWVGPALDEAWGEATQESGALARSLAGNAHVAAEVVAASTGLSTGLGCNHRAARYREFGTKPHTETPHGRALKFSKGDGGFATRAPNPGEPARPFIRPAAARLAEFFASRARSRLG